MTVSVRFKSRQFVMFAVNEMSLSNVSATYRSSIHSWTVHIRMSSVNMTNFLLR